MSALLLLAAMVQTAPVPIVAPPPAGPVAAPSARALALGRDLAEVLNSEALTRVQLDKMLSESVPQVFAKDPQMAAIEKAYPGAAAALIAALAPVIREVTIAALPGMWRELAPIYAARLSATEIEQLLVFYRSRTGIRLIDAMGRGADYSTALSRVVASGTSDISPADLRSGAAPGIAEVVRSASAEDGAAMVALTRTSAGAKLPAITQAVHERITQLANARDPETEKRIEALTVRTLQEHMARGGKR